jgi:hypothetical protein
LFALAAPVTCTTAPWGIVVSIWPSMPAVARRLSPSVLTIIVVSWRASSAVVGLLVLVEGVAELTEFVVEDVAALPPEAALAPGVVELEALPFTSGAALWAVLGSTEPCVRY